MLKKIISLILTLLLIGSLFSGVFEVMALADSQIIKLNVNFDDETAENRIDYTDGVFFDVNKLSVLTKTYKICLQDILFDSFY